MIGTGEKVGILPGCPGRAATIDVGTTMKLNIPLLVFLAVTTSLVSSCVPLAVGAAAGYVAHDEGYRVQNPIRKR